MSDFAELRKRILELPPKRVALLALELQERLEKERAARAEPIAVIGMACRFPGGSNSPDAFWAMLEEGRDAIVEIPADRWDVNSLYDPDPDAPGKVATRWGGYLDDVQRFDNEFFSISPREARAMDPQQRLLMETTWRAFEDAGIPPSRYYGAKAGVFVGICNNDYLLRLLKEGAEAMDLYLSSGNAYSVAAGRLSFTLGFQGPAISVDTACSSSLVSLHMACNSLLNSEADLAVAAGVNVLCSAETTMALSRSHMMAPDGRCKTFDDSADGFVRSEGCGVVLLKRLSDAQRDGDRIHALIRSTAINQDGRSTGLTVPNGPAQEQVIRDALARARLAPDDIDYIEAHGTGTSLGDPIEIRALGRVFGKQRKVPLYVGSVKTNFGHLESAAGVAGVIKTILSIRNARIPKHLHFRTPSRHIDWDDYAIAVPADGAPWPETGRPRRAGVSSFGFSGTNAHVIIEQAPVVAPSKAHVSRPAELLVLSGTTAAARDTVADAWRAALDASPDDRFADLCHGSRAGRTHFGYRSAIVARDRASALRTLAGDADGLRFDSPARCVEAPGVVFTFTGQGAQHPGMGRALYESAPAFRRAIDRCAEILNPLLELPLTKILFEGSGDDAPIYRTSLAQPAVVAFEYALAELWRAWGVQPAAVLGHSLGEYVAATVAGVLRLEDTLPLVRERGRLLESLPGGHKMAAVFASAETLAPMLAAHPGAHIAAYNAPENTVLSGPAAITTAVLDECAARGIEHRVLRLDQAFHSPGVEPVMDALQAAASRVTHQAPRIPIAWNVTGEVGSAAADAGQYWRNHARQPVRFTQGVRALAEQGFRHFLEVGPHPTLSPLVSQAVDGAVVVPSLRRGGEPWQDIAEAAAQLYVHGVDFDWRAYDEGFTHDHVAVPGHPFNGYRYWVDAQDLPRQNAPRGAVPGARLSSAVPIFETIFTPAQPLFLDQHRFRGKALLPGPLFAELGRRAALDAGVPADAVEGLEIRAAAFIDDAGTRVQTVLEATDDGTRFRVLSCPVDGTETWTEHASGWLRAAAGDAPAVAPSQGDDWTRVDVPEYRRTLHRLGFELGPDAALYSELELNGRRARASLVPATGNNAGVAGALLLDAAIQAMAAALTTERAPEPRMLTGIGTIAYAADLDRAVRCDAVLHERTGASVHGDVTLRDANGEIVAHVSDVTLGRVAMPAGESDAWFHALEWRPIEKEGPAFEPADLEHAADHLAHEWPRISEEAKLDEYVDWLPHAHARVVRDVYDTLVQLGLSSESNLPDARALARKLGVVPRHHQLFERLLAVLVEGGVLERTATGFALVAAPTAEMHETPASCAPVAELASRCTAELAGVLKGSIDPLHLLFPGGSADLTRAVYADSPFGRAFNAAMAEAVAGVARTRDARMPLRLLEVGAGSGSTARAVLDILKDRSVEYTFTDISPTLVSTAQSALGGRNGIEFRVLDIEKPAPPDFATGTRDMVLAANVLHATTDIVGSLQTIRALLRPGGVVALLEGTRPEAWVDVTFGLTEGWWRFRDHALRESYPLLSAEQWSRALTAAGFTDVAFAPADRLASEAGQVIILARAPEAADAVATRMDDALVFDARASTDAAALLSCMRETAAAKEKRLWIVTEGAQSVVESDTPNEDAAALWGLGRTFALEHPDCWGGLIDIARGTDEAVAERQIAAATVIADEDQIAWRGGVRHHARIVPAKAPAVAPASVDAGTYLVSGGLGGLGLKVAHWLASNGATRLVLVGRSASPDRWAESDPRREALRTLLETGVEVEIRAADVSDRDALVGLFGELRASTAHPLRGIVHAAAVFDSTPISSLDAERYDRVFAPKARGARVLAELAHDFELNTFILFSSTTALLGVVGLGAYAASNHYLDALAVRLRREGVPALSVNWGLWDEMRLAGADDARRYEQTGLLTMDSTEALHALGRLVAAGASNGIVAHVDWARLRGVYESRRRRPLLAELDHTNTTEAPKTSGVSLFDELALSDIDDDVRRARIVEAVDAQVRAVLRMTSGSLDEDRGFFEMGMDSLMSVELKTRLEKRFGVKLPATLTFNYPTIAAVAGYMEELLRERAQAARDAADGAAANGGAPAKDATVDGAAGPVDPSTDDIDDLSESALAELLGEKLRRLESGGVS